MTESTEKAYEPINELEKELAEAAQNQAKIPGFFRLLMDSELTIIGDVKSNQDGKESPKNKPGERDTINFEQGEVEGQNVVFGYTSPNALAFALERAERGETPYVLLPTKTIFRLLVENVGDCGLFLNASLDFGKLFIKEEMKGLLSGMADNRESSTISGESSIQLRKPEPFPADLIAALSSLLEKEVQLTSLHIAEHSQDQGSTWNYFCLFEFDTDVDSKTRDRVLNDIAIMVQHLEMGGRFLDMVELDERFREVASDPGVVIKI